MKTQSCTTLLFTAVLASMALAGTSVRADAQTTVVLNVPATQVADTMLQAGVFATTNFNAQSFLATRASTSPDYRRRALLTFDTEQTIPAGATIQSATLALTIKAGNADANRTIGVFPVTTSFVPGEATWNVRLAGTTWGTEGGDLGPLAVQRVVTNTPGTIVVFDVTPVVQSAVSAGGSRSTRLALADLGASTATSYREYFASEAADPSVRPALTIVYGEAASPPPPTCSVTLDKSSLSVGVNEANWVINVATASTCVWHVASDSDWLVVKSTVPASATGNGYAKIRAVVNTTSASKRTGHITINNVSYTVSQSGCGTNCATNIPTTVWPPYEPPPGPAMLRVLQYNTHHGGWGTDGVWDRNRILDWVMVANPDLISMNEIEIGTSWSYGLNDVDLYRAALELRTGYAWHAVFCEGDGRATGIGNMVLSRYALLATATQFLSAHRCAVNVTVAISGRNINFTSTHLDNVLASNRIVEVNELLPFESSLAEPRLILGDTNASAGTTEMNNLLAGGGGYVDAWVAAKALGTAVGNGMTRGSKRIDYIFLSNGGVPILSLKSVEIFHTANATGVMPSDHEPVLAVFEVK